VTYICCSAKKKVVTYSILFLFSFLFFIVFFNAFFWVFRNKGSPKTRKKTFFSRKSIWAHHKKCGFFFVRFFFLPPGCLYFGSIFLIAFLGVS
jgi:hypothetical protein